MIARLKAHRPRPVIRAIARVVVDMLVFNALSPLRVLAQDKATASPAAQRQMQQMAAAACG